MSKGIRYFLATLALLAWVACMAASMTANVKFGLMVAGEEGWNPWVLGAATASSDIFKSVAPIVGLYFLFRRWYWPAFAALLVMVVTVSYSTIAAIGFASVTRAHYSDARTSTAIASKRGNADIDSLRQKRDFLPKTRPVGVVENDIARVELARAWKATENCSSVNGPSERKFCSEYLALQSELASAKEYRQVTSDIVAAEAKLDKGGGFVSDPDPQAKQLAKLTGLNRDDVTTALVLLMAGLLEIGSSFGLTLALALVRPEHGVVAEALSMVMPAATAPEDPRKVSTVPKPEPPKAGPDGPGTPAPKPEPAEPPQAPTFHGRGSSKIVVGIKPAGDAEHPHDGQVVRRFSLKPPFIHTVPPARKAG